MPLLLKASDEPGMRLIRAGGKRKSLQVQSLIEKAKKPQYPLMNIHAISEPIMAMSYPCRLSSWAQMQM